MGGGTYSSTLRSTRSVTEGYHSRSIGELFSDSFNNAMDPYGLTVRESRDSEEHPKSLAVIVALDVTGSMGSIPHYILKKGLDDLVQGIIDSGIPDPQVLFLGIGDHTFDKAPLQVGQFESSDELLDHWLRTIWPEGGGGGNEGESYLLAWYLAARYTSIDCFEKRGKKGVLFTIGDEPCLGQLAHPHLEKIFGSGDEYPKTISANDLVKEAQQKYDVFHLHMKQTRSGSRESVVSDWKGLLGRNLIEIHNHEQVANEMKRIILQCTPVDHFHRVVRVR